jgi:hypothetical protein
VPIRAVATTERLAEQVLHALYELLRGFQAAHDASRGRLLSRPLAERPDEVYRAPWRHRWPDDVRDEVLARLLELNAERAREEVRSGAAASKKGRGKGGKRRAAKPSSSGDLFS